MLFPSTWLSRVIADSKVSVATIAALLWKVVFMAHPEETTMTAAEPGFVNQGTAGTGTLAWHTEDTVVALPTGMAAPRQG